MRGVELFFKSFSMLDRAGLHVIPKHYYTPVPDCKWLEENRPLWIGRSSLTGISWDLPEQLAWLKQTCEPYYQEVAGLKFYHAQARNGAGPGFGSIESQVLHCFMRRYAPEKVIEIGSGVSTMCMLEARRFNQREGRLSKITCVEPFPSNQLRRQDVDLIEQVCQQVPLKLFESLCAGDLLFIDSSHAVKVGSDVLRIYLEIIPHLPPGIVIHIHDIYLPYAYPRSVFTRPFWWQETAMLMALLVNNSRIKVLSCLSALHYDYPEQLQQVLTDYRPQPNIEGLLASPKAPGDFPASIWLQTV
jgi:Methyltransferase domain